MDMIPEFSPEIGFWSSFTFWFVFVNTGVTAVFLVVVIIGGIFDLKFLFRSLCEEIRDETDDGRVVSATEDDSA